MSVQVKSFVREFNRYNILNKIRISEKISRIDISKTIGLSQAAVTSITSELIKEGLIVEKETGKYAGGRRPVLLAINPEGTHVMGVSIKNHEIFVVIINFQAEVKATYQLPLEEDTYSPDELVEKIAYAIKSCLWDSNFSKDSISGIGISVPALVDSASGVIRKMPIFGWDDVDIKTMLQARVNHKIYMNNDTNNLAIAEHWFGEGKGLENFILVSIETGVGAGIVVNGQLILGKSGMAGEFGRLLIDPKGPTIRGKGRGRLSTYAGIDAILRDVERFSGLQKWSTKKKGQLLFEDVLEQIKAGNPEVIGIYKKAGEVLGIGICNLILLFNPEKIIIVGRGTQAGDVLLGPMFEFVNEHQPDDAADFRTDIVIKPWANEDWARGAGTLVLQEIYKSPAMK